MRYWVRPLTVSLTDRVLASGWAGWFSSLVVAVVSPGWGRWPTGSAVSAMLAAQSMRVMVSCQGRVSDRSMATT